MKNFQEIQIWHVKADSLVCWGHEFYETFVTETQGILTLQNIACPDFQNLNNFLYFNFVKNLANSRLPKSVISVIEIL